ncbi:MAG: 50S ribosomal protein L25/general stress protein Ctc [Bauldia sp.]|nr:50S ribosomal protein L25/general stress protein Ctc [Bauldia sp.]
MSAAYELTASVRDRTGKGAARATRREGMIPAVIYGGGEAPLAVKVDHKSLTTKIHAGGFLTTLVTLDVGGQKIRVIPRDYQLDPVRDWPVHVDFLRVTAGSKITVDVPVHFINESASPGIKRGGVLNIVRHTVEMICPVDAIPESIVCDLTGLEINDSVHISAVELPDNVVPTIRDRDFTIATIAAPAGLKDEAAEAATATPEAGAAPAAAAAPAKEKDKG